MSNIFNTEPHTSGHSIRCVENALYAIGENNEATRITEPDLPADRLTPETESEALEWLANGNQPCADDGEFCNI